MSRRKQSNPKPIKRQSEDSLESIAALLHLPLDVFRVQDPQDDVREYTLYTNRALRSGLTFGPYRGKVVNNDSTEEDGESLQHPSFETKGENGDDILFAVIDESGGWLKLLRPVQSPDDFYNAAVFHNGSAAWCTITCDLESDKELLVRHWWTNDIAPTTQRQRGDRLRGDGVSPDTVEEERNNDSDTDQHHIRRRSPNVYCDMFNGRMSVDPVVKCEPSSPATPPPSSGIPGEEHCRNTEDAPAYLNGSNYAPAFPCGGTIATAKTDGPLRCEQCDTFFNSRRILDVHQSYYCQGKATLSSDTDTDDITTSSVKTELTAVHSPGASENDDTSPPPKDLPASTPSEDAFSPNSSSSAKRRRESAVLTGDGTSPSSKGGRLFRCQYCSYSTDKKASLTRHVRMHGGVGRTSDGPPVATPPMARYCANCDIQFASYKNYQVHKEFYCNTRHVHKSVTTSSPSVQPPQPPSLATSQPPLPLPQPSQSHSPRNTTHSPTQGPSSLESVSPSSSKPGYNVVINHHQPLYAAISTSPLILVPCSYVAGAGGLSPGLIPAGNIVIPNPHQASSPESTSPKSGGNVIPTFTVMPPDASPVPAEGDLPQTVAKPEAKVAKVLSKESSPKVPKALEVLSKSPGKEETVEQPLDLSFRKREEERTRPTSPLLHMESGSRRSCSPPTCDDLPSVPPNLPIMPLLHTDLMSRDAPQGSTASLLAAPPVLVKQGASKCTDCNIVFYKHENYLVHKSKYCAARTSGSRASDSPDKSSRDGMDLSSDREESGKTNHQKSPITSPRVNSNSRTPPATTNDGSDSCETTPLAPVVQYYCMACGIKYTSLDNLRAHQFYYCPKREMQPLALVPTYPAALQQQQQLNSNNSTSNRISDYKCGKCKNAYPTEELLRQHPCVVQRKCPYCDVYCPTLSAAQRHLVTHTGIKSFRCSLCGYKGHTLRGMRTHIRIHLDKNSSTPEEAYILCMDEGGAEIGCAGRKAAGLRVNSERIKSVISTEPPPEMPVSPVSPAVVVPQAGILPADIQLAIKAVPDDPVATGDTTHWCQICGYSSSYKGNVVRHVKLVHKDLVSTQAMSNVVNSRPGNSCADALLLGKQQTEQPIERTEADHSNSSSSLDVKPLVVNGGLPSKASEPVLRLDEKPPLILKAESSSSPPPNGGSSKGVKRPLSADESASLKSGPKYCKSCDISFNFLSNFLAHKKFYCTPRQSDVNTQESTSAQPVQ